jgi:hypothetical protein
MPLKASGFLPVILFLISCPLQGDQTIPMPDLINPDSISVQNDRVYITEGESILIYDRTTLNFLKKFGKKGEGPGEFRFAPGGTAKLNLCLRPGGIMVNSINRVTFFNFEGGFLGEKNIPSGNRFIAVEDRYVGYTTTREDKLLYLTINLYDSEFKPIRRIIRQPYYVQVNKPFNLIKLGLGNLGRAVYAVYDSKVYVAGDRDVIHVFNSSGIKERDLRPIYEKIRITPAHIHIIRDELDALYTSETMRKLIREKGFFPDYFPVRPFRVADRTIYIPTHRKKHGQTEFILMDLKGEVNKSVFVDFRERTFLLPSPYTIHEGMLYQLFEDGDSEEQRIHITPIGRLAPPDRST